MSEQQMNVAIAEACGWKHVRYETPAVNHGNMELIGIPPSCKKVTSSAWMCKIIPNYTGDLNAINEAVMYADSHATAWNAPDGRNDTFQEAYMYHLAEVCKCGYWSIVHATARQRAEAFLRALGKWGV